VSSYLIRKKGTVRNFPNPIATRGKIGPHFRPHFIRATIDVDILVSGEGLARLLTELDERGFVRPFCGRRNLKDVQTRVRIEFLVQGQFTGDGKRNPSRSPIPRHLAK
jgi:hypothetical protein